MGHPPSRETDKPGLEDGRVVEFCPKNLDDLPMHTKQAKEIVPPEPHSTGPDIRKAWNYMPHWLQIILLLVVMVGGVLVVIFAQDMKTDARWLLSSGRYKSEVLAQPMPGDGEFKHLEWDAWGWATIDTTAYLVFDPSNSLSRAASTHESGKFAGISCEVPNVRRLESQWYLVTFYTNQQWGRCD